MSPPLCPSFIVKPLSLLSLLSSPPALHTRCPVRLLPPPFNPHPSRAGRFWDLARHTHRCRVLGKQQQPPSLLRARPWLLRSAACPTRRRRRPPAAAPRRKAPDIEAGRRELETRSPAPPVNRPLLASWVSFYFTAV